MDEKATEFENQLDDYNSILVKALGDRLAEAFAEYLHLKVRKEIWGYASEEQLSNQELIKENYKGIRPAPGYPACPAHLEKPTIWDILKVEENEIEVRIINNHIINNISNLVKPIIKLEFEGNKYIAKANLIYSSSIPESCDYFYTIDKEGKIYNVSKGVLLFYKRTN